MANRTAIAMLCAIHNEVSKKPEQVLAWDDKFLETITGYMRPLVTHKFADNNKLGAVPDQGTRFATATPDGRLVVLVVTGIGNVVVMDHHRDKNLVVYNAPKELNGLWDKVLQSNEIESILGFSDSDHNIGHIVKAIGLKFDDMNPWK